MRTFLLTLVALALAAALVWMRYFQPTAGTQEPTAAATPVRPVEPPLPERLARLDARLRLPPDRRALAAIAEVRRLVHGGKAAEAEVGWASGSWKVRYGGEPLAVLSPFPRFDALLGLLDAWAAKERGRPGAVSLDPDVNVRPELHDLLNGFDDASAFGVLVAVDTGWRGGKANVGDLLAATDALAQLCLILPRDSAAADRLAAHALASLALARQYAPERTLRAEVSIAYAMGYVEHAVALAARLPRDEPLAAYVRRDFAALSRVAEWSKSGDVHFYYAARLVQARSDQEWIAWSQTLKPEDGLRIAIVGTALAEHSPALGRFVPELYASTLLTRFGVSTPANARPDWPLAQCDALGGRLTEGAKTLHGPFAEPELYTETYRSACLAAVYRKLVHWLDANDSEAALALARGLPQGALREWTELVAGGDAALRGTTPVVKAIAAPGLSGAARLTLAQRAVDALPADDPKRSDVADALARGLDSRAAGRSTAGDLAHDVYLDPDLEEKLYGATLDLDRLERPLLAARLASFRRDWQTLWVMAETDEFRLEEKMAALEGLERQKPLESLRLRRGYERLLTANPSVEPLRRQFARYLEKTLRTRKAAREVLLPILAAHDGSDAASDSAAGVIARLYREDGDPRSAWQLLEPRLPGMRVPYEAARAQLALGDTARAEEIARAAYAHYPHSLAPAAELAAVLWQTGQNAPAAEVIAKFPAAASDKDRCYHFCRAFARVFRGKPPAEVEAAFHELVAARVDYALLSGTIATFSDTAEPETALALGKQIDLPGALVDAQTESYKTLKRMHGEAEALRWLTAQIPRDGLGVAAKTFYDRGADELLWKLVDDPDQQGGSATWLLRAAAYAREEHPLVSHRQALAAYFSTHRDTADEQLGAALVGLLDGPTLLERAKNEADLSRAAYYLGARAEGRRDLHEAMRMYQLALFSRQKTPGRDLALDAATRIHGANTSLDALAADPALGAVVAAAP